MSIGRMFGREIPPTGEGDFYVVGEAPGQNEDRMGIPFVGASGNLLFRTLANEGITRKICRVGNVFWRKPPGNSLSEAKKHPSYSLYKEKIKEDILERMPKVILACGSEALNLFFPEAKITSSRGYVFEWNSIPIMPTYHPSSLLRDMTRSLPFKSDIMKAAKIYKYGFDVNSFRAPDIPLFPNSKDKLMDLLGKISIGEIEKWSLDIETNQTPWRTNCIGIATREGAANAYPNEEIIGALKEAVKRSGGNCILHNANFDLSWLYGEFGIEWEDAPHDTMVMHHLLLADQPKSLEFCVSIYLNVPAWKFLRTSHDEQKWLYNLYDCIYTYKLYDRIKEELESIKCWDVYNNQKRKELIPAIFMGLLGMKLDRKRMEEHRERIQGEMYDLENLLFSISGELNLNSHVQMKNLLYKEWGILPVKIKGKISVKEEAIKEIINKNKRIPEEIRDWLKKYLEWKHLSSIISKELSMETSVFYKDIILTSYNIAGTEGARWSSSAPLWGGGTNFQNRSKPFRDIYKPRWDDYIFLGADYSGAEARIVAWRCGDEICKQAFLEGKDIHKITASMMFGCKIEDVTKDLRNIGKRLRHAGNYDMSWRKLSQIMEISASESKELMLRYHRAYPDIRGVFHEKTREIIRREKMLKDAFGLPRIFTGRLDDKAFREGFAFYPQSTCTHTLNKALLALWEWSKEREDIALQHQIHDEVVLLVKKDKNVIMETAEKIKEAMSIPIPIYDLKNDKIEELILPIEFSISFTFKKDYETKTLEGVEEWISNNM